MSSIQTFDSLFQVIDISSGASVRADTFVRFAEPGTTNSTLQAGRRERATSNKPAEPGHWGRSDHPFSGPTYTEQSDTRRSSLVRSPPRDFNHHHHRRRRSSLFRQTRLGRVQRAERLRIVSPHASRADFPFPYRSPSLHRPALVSSFQSFDRHLALSPSSKRDPLTTAPSISGTPSTLVPSFRVASFREQSRPLLLLRLNQSVLVDLHCLALASHRPRLSQRRPLSAPTDRPTARIPTTHNQSRPSPFLPPGPHECPDNCA